VLLENMAYADDDESLLDAEVCFSVDIIFFCQLSRYNCHLYIYMKTVHFCRKMSLNQTEIRCSCLFLCLWFFL